MKNILFLVVLLSFFNLACKVQNKNDINKAKQHSGFVRVGDFNADRLTDTLSVVKLPDIKNPELYKTINLWSSDNLKQGEKYAILISHRGKAQKYLFHDSSFFATPAWLSGKPPVHILKRNNKEYTAWKKDVPALHGDGVLIGTEAGIDILLYWDGKNYKLFWPNEEP